MAARSATPALAKWAHRATPETQSRTGSRPRKSRRRWHQMPVVCRRACLASFFEILKRGQAAKDSRVRRQWFHALLAGFSGCNTDLHHAEVVFLSVGYWFAWVVAKSKAPRLVTCCKPPDVQCRETVARLMTANLLDSLRFCFFMPQIFADSRRLEFNTEMPTFAARARQQILHLGVHRNRVAHRKQPIKPRPFKFEGGKDVAVKLFRRTGEQKAPLGKAGLENCGGML